jgi:tetratricopeptide (TPR) repeat protein
MKSQTVADIPSGMGRALYFLVCAVMVLASTTHAAGPNCTYGTDPNCLRNYDVDYRGCYSGSSPRVIVAACRAWLVKDPMDTGAYIRLGGQYRALGDYDAAIAAYSKVIEARPKFAYAYCDRGSVYEMKGAQARAITDYRKCLELDPIFPPAQRGLKRLGVRDL